jgi:hypothetical protein
MTDYERWLTFLTLWAGEEGNEDKRLIRTYRRAELDARIVAGLRAGLITEAEARFIAGEAGVPLPEASSVNGLLKLMAECKTAICPVLLVLCSFPSVSVMEFCLEDDEVCPMILEPGEVYPAEKVPTFLEVNQGPRYIFEV